MSNCLSNTAMEYLSSTKVPFFKKRKEVSLKQKKLRFSFTIRTIIRGEFDLYRTKLEENLNLVIMDSY